MRGANGGLSAPAGVEELRSMVETFTAHRALLFGIGYRMLGSVAEAEDLVQETYVRWQAQEADAIESPKAWLVATLTRLGIDQLRSARRRREEYVGSWLPEPIVDHAAPAPDRVAAQADSLGVAFLVLLEALGPVERAAFLLREVFEYDYAEIATIVGKSEANCRQMVSRAKNRLAQREPARAEHEVPVEGDGSLALAATARGGAERLVQRFMTACTTGNIGELLAMLTDDAVLYSDGGGRVRAALRPILGADRISRFYAGLHERAFAKAEFSLVRVNGGPGALMRGRDGRVSVMAFAVAEGRIRAIYTIMNPEKLRHI